MNLPFLAYAPLQTDPLILIPSLACWRKHCHISSVPETYSELVELLNKGYIDRKITCSLSKDNVDDFSLVLHITYNSVFKWTFNAAFFISLAL